MKRFLTLKVTSLVLVFCLFVTSFSSVAYASTVNDKKMQVNGYQVSVLENDDTTCTIETTVGEGNYYATFNKLTQEITLKTIKDKPQILSNKDSGSSINYYKVKVEEFKGDILKANILDNSNGKTYKVSSDDTKIKAQATIAGGAVVVGGAVGAALEALLMTIGCIVSSGVIYYVASDAIENFKKGQPEVHYYHAILFNGKVYFGPALSDASAVNILKANGDVYAMGQYYAMDACRKASPRKIPFGPECHGDEEYLDHYHPGLGGYNHTAAHCWYI